MELPRLRMWIRETLSRDGEKLPEGWGDLERSAFVVPDFLHKNPGADRLKININIGTWHTGLCLRIEF